jgi:hypothetical protein
MTIDGAVNYGQGSSGFAGHAWKVGQALINEGDGALSKAVRVGRSVFGLAEGAEQHNEGISHHVISMAAAADVAVRALKEHGATERHKATLRHNARMVKFGAENGFIQASFGSAGEASVQYAKPTATRQASGAGNGQRSTKAAPAGAGKPAAAARKPAKPSA